MCSKCRSTLEESQFVKSERYSDGCYPSCKQCQTEAKLKTFRTYPLCFLCGVKPHLEGRGYCYECDRIKKGRPIVPKFRRDPSNKTLCSRCKINPRSEYHRYCRSCQDKSFKEWRERTKKIRLPSEKRRKLSARFYVNGLLKRGKIKRQPCKYCGAPGTNFHHLDYKDRTRNIEHVCFPCHVRLEREKRKMLTKQHGVK